MYQRQVSQQVASVTRSGFAGVCSFYLIFFGIFLFIVSTSLIGMSYDATFQDEFFQSGNSGKRIAGFILLTICIIVFIIGISLCCYVCKSVSKASRSSHQPGAVLSTGPVVSGQAPPSHISGYHMQGHQPSPVPSYPPTGPQPYGTGIQSYPVAGPQPYPPPARPQVYPPQQGAQQYPPQQPYAPQQGNPSQPPVYPSAPGAGYSPVASYASTGPSAPPPSYHEAVPALPEKGDIP